MIHKRSTALERSVKKKLLFCHFPMWCPGSDVVLDCDLCLLPYIYIHWLVLTTSALDQYIVAQSKYNKIDASGTMTFLLYLCDTCLTWQQRVWIQIQAALGQSPPVLNFHGNWTWNNFYYHSPPSADSRRVVGIYIQKQAHEVLFCQACPE